MVKKSEREEIKAAKLVRPPLKTERMICDDFEVEVDGVMYHPHLEEFVDIIPIRRLSTLRNLMELASYAPDPDAAFGDAKLMKQYDGIAKFLSDSILDWSFTDEDGKPLPKPYHDPQVIEMLGMDEINYLVGKLIGGRTDDAQKDSPVSPTT